MGEISVNYVIIGNYSRHHMTQVTNDPDVVIHWSRNLDLFHSHLFYWITVIKQKTTMVLVYGLLIVCDVNCF